MKFCLIGSRGHYPYIFQSIDAVPDLDFCGFSPGCEDSPDTLLKLAARHGIAPPVFDDWHTMLDLCRPDAAAVDGPFDKHAEMCAELLSRGIPVFCEKPVALTLTDLNRIESAQKRSGAYLLSMVGLRYDPAFQYALKLVREGAVGRVMMVRAQKSYQLGERPEFYRHRETFGGTIPWVGSHALDWIMAFSGGHFQTVSATATTAENRGHGDLETACLCLFRMDNGVQAAASIDYLRPAAAPSHGDDRVRVAGSGGILEVADGKITLIDEAGLREIPVPPPERFIFSDFVKVVRRETEPFVTVAETLELTRACLLARDAADSGQLISF